MKYFLVAGEASGDLHASHLMQALRQQDPEAEFCFFGGSYMQSVGGKMLRHYKTLAYMGFIPVLLHARTILKGLAQCKEAIRTWQPDAVILVDYAGFNLKVARYVKQQGICPVFYYISPKIWAWKERRIKQIRKGVDRMFSILPFEVDYYERRHHYSISYVGNPTLDEVEQYKQQNPMELKKLLRLLHLNEDTRIISLLPGSRVQEIHDNLRRMLKAVQPLTEQGYSFAVCVAPGIDETIYHTISKEMGVHLSIVKDHTYDLLYHSYAALVTSGTATLEAGLFNVPQVVCYYMSCGKLVNLARRLFLRVRYISLVNLICDREVIPELVANDMTPRNVRKHLLDVIEHREEILAGYADMRKRLGEPGAPQHCAREIIAFMRKR